MTRVLAVDFGEKRIGLATADTVGSIATPQRTIPRSSDEAAAKEIARFCREEQIETLLVGVPRSPEDGRESVIAPRIRSFAEKLDWRSWSRARARSSRESEAAPSIAALRVR